MNLKLLNKKTFELDDFEQRFKIKEYSELVNSINKLIFENKIAPVKISGGNGKIPTLYIKYRVLESIENNEELIKEIQYKLSSKFDITYYEKHIDKYKEHREYIIALSNFLINSEHLLEDKISMNERSFQIWGREKFLQKESGKTILKNLCINLEYLNFYDTSEPLAYYSSNKNTPQNVLIIENKDTYYTLRNHLINNDNNKILDKKIDTLIYGGGKGVIKAFNDFEISVEKHVSNELNSFYYFGDLDYEGIVIYETFHNNFSNKYKIEPFVDGYIKMIEKVKTYNINLPKTKEGQNKNVNNIFIEIFSSGVVNNISYKEEIEKILKEDLYIPQEIINITDL